MGNLINKKNIVLELFKILINSKKHKNDILKELKISETTFYKNISKLKKAGFNVIHSKQIYEIQEYCGILKLDKKEKEILANMLNLSSNFLSIQKDEEFQNLMQKIILFSNEDDYNEIIHQFKIIKKNNYIKDYEEKIKNIENNIKQHNKIKIILNKNKDINILPIKFNWYKNKIYLYYLNLDNNHQEKILPDKIIKIANYNKKMYIPQNQQIVFELYNKLAKTYLLKYDETVIDVKKDSLVVGTDTKDKKKLFKRLLRYDTLCKILFPKTDVEEFNKLIDKSIENINN